MGVLDQDVYGPRCQIFWAEWETEMQNFKANKRERFPRGWNQLGMSLGVKSGNQVSGERTRDASPLKKILKKI